MNKNFMFILCLISILIIMLNCNNSVTLPKENKDDLQSNNNSHTIQGNVKIPGMTDLANCLVIIDKQIEGSETVSVTQKISRGTLDTNLESNYFNTATTDKNGFFKVSGLSEGKYTVTVQKKNTLGAIIKDIEVKENRAVTVVLDIVLTATGSISGKVSLSDTTTDLYGTFIYAEGTSFIAACDNSGDFKIENIPIGSWNIVYYHEGYASQINTNVSVTAAVNTPVSDIALQKIIKNTWKGELSTPPSNPELNWAYYNTIDGKSYIWDGDSWEILAIDGDVKKVITPAIIPGGGSYNTIQVITIYSSTDGATIRYTINDNNINENYGTVYTTPIVLSESATIRAIAYKTGMKTSSIASATFDLTGIPTTTTTVIATTTTIGPISTSGIIAEWLFDGTADDTSGSEINGIVSGATLTTDRFGIANKAYYFDGIDDKISINETSNISYDTTNDFIYTFWMKAEGTILLQEEANSGVAGLSDQRYVIFPAQGAGAWGTGHAGVGISAGINGISVFEHSDNYIAPLLVYQFDTTNDQWTYITVKYNNRTAFLYVNGVLIKQGLTSTFEVHPSLKNGALGGDPYGYFKGSIDDFRVYNRALSSIEINNLYLENNWTPPTTTTTVAFTDALSNLGINTNIGPLKDKNGNILRLDYNPFSSKIFTFEKSSEVYLCGLSVLNLGKRECLIDITNLDNNGSGYTVMASDTETSWIDNYLSKPVSGDFNGDCYDEIIVAYYDSSLNKVVLREIKSDTHTANSFTYTNVNEVTVQNYSINHEAKRAQLCAASGDIDGDGKYEILITFVDKLFIFDDATANYQLLLEKSFPSLRSDGSKDWQLMQVKTADLDSDGKHEIILTNGDGTISTAATYYIFNDLATDPTLSSPMVNAQPIISNSYDLSANETTSNKTNWSPCAAGIATGDFDGDKLVDIAFCGRISNVSYGFITLVLKTTMDANSNPKFEFLDTVIRDSTNYWEYFVVYPIAAGHIDNSINNKTSDIVASWNWIRVENGLLKVKGQLKDGDGYPMIVQEGCIAIGDIDNHILPDSCNEIVIKRWFPNYPSGDGIVVFKVGADGVSIPYVKWVQANNLGNLSNSLCLAATQHPPQTVEFQDHVLQYTKPQVIAVLASPPFDSSVNQAEGSTSFGKSVSSEYETNETFGFEVGASFGFKIGVDGGPFGKVEQQLTIVIYPR